MVILKPLPCTQPGFTKPAPLDTAGALLPHLCTLACSSYEHGSKKVIGGVFLWHYPHGHPHWSLASKFDHLGARTFLNRGFIVEIQQISIAITSPAFRFHNALKRENLPVGL